MLPGQLEMFPDADRLQPKAGRKRIRQQKEFKLHCAVVDTLRKTVRPGIPWLHIPNGEERTEAAGKRLKRMGVLPGAADLHFVLPPDGRAAYLELKPIGEPMSESQKNFSADVRAAGALYKCAWGYDMAIEILQEWDVLKPLKIMV